MFTVREERCGEQEYQCADMSCINIDSVCDGKQDCADLSDEQNCGKKCLIYNTLMEHRVVAFVDLFN